MNQTKFEVYFSQAQDWRWRLKAGNGEIVAVSEGYTSKSTAKAMAERVKQIAFNAIIVELA